MDQATEATTPTAPLAVDSFEHAAAVAARIVSRVEPKPSSVRIDPTFPSGWTITLAFLSHEVRGLFRFAASVDVPVSRVSQGDEFHLEALTHVDEVEVRGFAFATTEQVAQLQDPPVSDTVVPAVTPTVGTSPTDIVVPDTAPVLSLAKAAVSGRAL